MTDKVNVNHAILNGLWDPKECSKKAAAASALVCSKAVVVISNEGEITEYNSISEASRNLNIPNSTLSRAISLNKNIKGYKLSMK